MNRAEMIERLEAAEAELEFLRPLADKNLRVRLSGTLEGDTLEGLLDNQAWVLLSHVGNRVGRAVGNPDLMEAWQEAWAEGQVREGYFSAHRGVAAWIAADIIERLKAPHDTGERET